MKLRNSKRTWITVILTSLVLVPVSTWPAPLLLFDYDPLTSMQIYGNGLLNRPTKLISLGTINKESKVCGIGPYDSFLDVRFSKTLTPENQAASEAVSKIIDTPTSEQTQIVAVTNSTAVTVFRSSVFQFTRTTKTGSTEIDCVTPSVTGTPTVSVRNGFLIGF